MPSKKLVESAIQRQGKPYRKRALEEVKNPPKRVKYKDLKPPVPAVEEEEEEIQEEKPAKSRMINKKTGDIIFEDVNPPLPAPPFGKKKWKGR